MFNITKLTCISFRKKFLRKELNFNLKSDKDWIKKIEIDIANCHLFCCSTNDLYIYDFNGNLMRHFQDLHKMSITAVCYSPKHKLVLTGSLDSNVKAWNLQGLLVQTFSGHSKAITKLILNPFNSNLVLSSSIDGFVKMWCLDTMQEIYEWEPFKWNLF